MQSKTDRSARLLGFSAALPFLFFAFCFCAGVFCLIDMILDFVVCSMILCIFLRLGCSSLCHHRLEIRADALCLCAHDSLELVSGQQQIEAGRVDDEAFCLFHQIRQKVLERDGCQT